MAKSTIGLFDIFDNCDIVSSKVDQIYNWPESQLEQLVQACASVAMPRNSSVNSFFNFAANDRLSGIPAPCKGEHCRLSAADELARFTALYADHVIIRNPFLRYTEHSSFPVTNDTQRYYLSERDGLVGDIKVMFFFRPLFEAGLLSFANHHESYCPVCVYEADRLGVLDQFVGKEGTDGWHKRVSKMVTELKKQYLTRATATLFLEEGVGPSIELKGDDGIIEHGELVHHDVTTPESWLKELQRGPKKLSPQQLWKSRVLNLHITRIIEDISMQNHYSMTMGFNYITDRDVDLSLVDVANNRRTRPMNRALVEGLGHPLPFLQGVPLRDLISLRKKDGESFQVYRDAVASAVKTTSASNPEEIRQVLHDLIQPELNKIDLTFKTARKTMFKTFTSELGISAGLVTIGLFSGLLPERWAEIGAAVGGVGGIKTLATKATEIFKKPKEVQENKFFFLWNAQRKRNNYK